MSTPVNADGRPTQGGASQPVTVLNALSVTLTGTIPGTVEIANDSGNPVPVSAADGGLVTQGAKADAAVIDPAISASVVALLKGDLTLTGALTETAPATDTASSGLNGRLQRIAQRFTSLIALLPAALGQGTMAQSLRVVLASDQSALSVTPTTQGSGVAVSLTRTNDTNVYAANDVIGAATGSTAALTFAAMRSSAGEIMLTSVALEIDLAAIISGMTSYRLYLYNITPPSALGDNAAWDLPSGDRSSFLGYVDLGTPVDLGSTLYVETYQINKQLTLSSTSLFGYLVTVGTFTPSASIVFKITLHAVAL